MVLFFESELPPPPPQVTLRSEDYGKHLLGVQDLLQKHKLVEADISSLAERVRALQKQATRCVCVMCAVCHSSIVLLLQESNLYNEGESLN